MPANELFRTTSSDCYFQQQTIIACLRRPMSEKGFEPPSPNFRA